MNSGHFAIDTRQSFTKSPRVNLSSFIDGLSRDGECWDEGHLPFRAAHAGFLACAGFRFPPDVVLLAIRWNLRC